MKSFRRGFTLIELLVVIGIIGIMSAIIIENLETTQAKGRDGKRISDVKQIQLMLEKYADGNGGYYPTTLGGLTNVPTPPKGTDQTSYNYIPYGTGGSCIGYHLGAVLELPNSSLTADADAAPSAQTCTGVTDFDGTSNKCDATHAAGATPGLCFDVINPQ